MSIRNGDKARSNIDQKKKRGMRQRNRELRKKLENKTTGQDAPDPARDGKRIVSSQLRRLTRHSKTGSDNGAGVLEIVAYRTPRRAE